MFRWIKRGWIRGTGIIDVMVIIVITGGILSIIIPVMLHRRAGRDFVSCQYNQRALASALENYALDRRQEEGEGSYPGELADLFTCNPPYLQRAPRCPATSTNYGYQVTDDRRLFTIYCRGGHGNILPPGYPRYSSVYGMITRYQDD